MAFIPFMFFYHRDHPWVGRTTRTRTPAQNRGESDAEPGPSSQHQLISRNESSDAFIQSNSSLGVGDSILLNSLNPITSKWPREQQSDKSSRGLRVSIKEDNTLHYNTNGESQGETITVVINPPPESARRRTRSLSSSQGRSQDLVIGGAKRKFGGASLKNF